MRSQLQTLLDRNEKSFTQPTYYNIPMFLYPFKTQFLKTELNRNQVADILTTQTFLSDANFKKTDSNPRAFYGEISNQDFTLETIEDKQRLVNFCTGEIRGSENEVYILLQLGAWQHRRIFLLFLILILSCTVLLAKHLWLFQNFYPQNFAAWLLLLTNIALFVALYVKAKNFHARLKSTTEFFCQLWSAKAIHQTEVPQLFR
jgi:hypothetical protein